MQRKQAPALRRPALLNRRNNMTSTFVRIGNKLNQQKDTRQATFLFRRGLKVQAQVQSTDDLDNQTVKRTRQWRTSTTSGGILTVSIDNPGAIISPISQKLQLTRSPVPPFLMKRDQSEEKKIPKGVPLQFDINSVGKQSDRVRCCSCNQLLSANWRKLHGVKAFICICYIQEHVKNSLLLQCKIN
ncbi:hypothetical protein Nmel_011780 [Mimus melanotis]